jgi:hypothetical protein
MKFRYYVIGLLMYGCSLAFAGDAGVEEADKCSYNLFKPTPTDLLRPVKMQAYDNIADPTTVDAGHFQAEGSLIDFFTSDKHFAGAGANYDYSETGYSWRPRFTAGLLNNLDLEVMPTYSVASSHVQGTFFGGIPINNSMGLSTFGPVIVESKLNLWGNDGGMTALSVSPVVSIPTGGGNVLGGLDGAFALRLPRGFYLKLESEIFQQRFGRKNYATFFEGLSINKSICSKWTVYSSVTGEVSSYSHMQWFGYAGFGAIYKMTQDFQMFGGLNFGLSDISFDYNPKFGIVWRR